MSYVERFFSSLHKEDLDDKALNNDNYCKYPPNRTTSTEIEKVSWSQVLLNKEPSKYKKESSPIRCSNKKNF